MILGVAGLATFFLAACGSSSTANSSGANVPKLQSFAFTQELGVTAVIAGFYQARTFSQSGSAAARADHTCPAGLYNASSWTQNGHTLRIGVVDSRVVVHDEYDNNGFDAASGPIAGDGSFHATGVGYRLDGTLNLKAGQQFPAPASAGVAATGTGLFEQSWSVVGQPCYPVWKLSFRLRPIGPLPAGGYTILPDGHAHTVNG